MKKAEKQALKENEYFIKMIEMVKEDIETGRHLVATYHSAFQTMSKERFYELIKTHLPVESEKAFLE